MTTNSQMTSMLPQNITNSEKNGSKSTKKAEILKSGGKTFGNKRNPIIEKQTKSIIVKDQSSVIKEMYTSAPVIVSCINSEVSGDSSPLDITMQEVTYYITVTSHQLIKFGKEKSVNSYN